MTRPADIARLLEPWGLANVDVGPTAGRGQTSQTWLVEVDGNRYVGKLIRDQRRYVEPGLRVAAAVEAGGIPAGAPLPTRDGELCIDVRVDGGSWTFALLRFAPGRRLARSDDRGPELAGTLLGAVHGILVRESAPTWVPANLLDWCELHGTTSAHADRNGAVRALAELRRLDTLGRLTWAVVYGDPSPEVLVDDATGELALIDWGTPSWGPLLHDVACWTTFYDPGSGDRLATFLAAYSRSVQLTGEELRALPLFVELAGALRLLPPAGPPSRARR